MKIWQIWNFQVKLDFRFQSFTLPSLHPIKMKLADLELSSKVGFQISKCHFNPGQPPSPQKWKVGQILNFQVALQITKCHPLPEIKSWQIWNFQVKLHFKLQSVTPPRNEKLADLELSSKVEFQISKCHFTPPPLPFPRNGKLADLELSSQVGLQISKFYFTPPPPNEIGRFGTF